jgi:hypothetical protein
MHHHSHSPGSGWDLLAVLLLALFLSSQPAPAPAGPQVQPASAYPADVQSDYDRALYDCDLTHWRRN